MANKKTTFNRAPGTDSKGNIHLPGGPAVLDLSDYDDLFGPEPGAKKESAWSQFTGGFKETLSGRLNTKDIVRNFLRSAAPDGISSMFGAYDDLKGSMTSIKDSLESTNASDLDYIARRAKDYLPQLKDYIPNGLYDDFNAGLESKIDDYQYTMQTQVSQTAIRAAAKQEQEDNQIKEALDNIALVSKQNHQHGERADINRDKAARAERGVRDIVQSKRFDYMARSMGMAVDNMARVANYQEQFDYGVKRKGLELQFRTYMGIKDLVKLAETSLQLQMKFAEQVVRNTGTPDYQKGSQSDLRKFQNGGRPQGGGFIGRAAAAIPRSLQQHLGGFGGKVEDNVKNSLSGRLSNIVQAARMGENSPGLWDQKYAMAGSFAGELAGDAVQSHLMPMMGRAARPMATKAMNKFGGGKHNQLGYFMDNIPAYAQEFVNNQNQQGWKGKLRDMMAPHLPTFNLNDRVKDGTYQTIDQQASFNQMTQRSITEVIPGLLSRAVQELRMIRTGDDTIAREVFDITTGKFAIEAKAQDNLQKRIIPDSAVRAASSTINDALNTMDKDGKLSPEARKALGERMLREASNNKRFDPEQYLKTRGYADGTDSETSDELGQFFRGKFEFDNKGKMKDTADNHQLRQDFSQAFLDIRSISKDPYKEIERLIASGRTEPLRLMGIITTEGNQDKINYDRIWEILRSGVTDTNPFAPGGSGFDPNKEDMSGTVGHENFMGPGYQGEGKRFVNKMKDKGAALAGPHIQNIKDSFTPTETAAKLDQLKNLKERFGSNTKKIAEEMGVSVSEVKDLMAKSTSHAKDQASGAYSKIMDKITPPAGNSYVPKGMDALTDLCSQFDPTNPLIKGIDFVQGKLIDVNTKKVIEKPSDITGAVINAAGLTVVTAQEAANGLFNTLGEKVVSPMMAGVKKAAEVVGKYTGLSAGSPETGMNGADSKDAPADYSLGPGEEVVITKRGLEGGEYFSRKTGKPITTLADLDGDIIDRNGDVVVTAKEVQDGLYNVKTGGRWRMTKGFGKVVGVVGKMGKFSGMTATQIGLHAMKFAGKAALGIASKVFNFVVPSQNAYLPDSPEAVLTRRALKAGEYTDEKGKPIENFLHVYGLIYGKDGEPVIPQDEYKNLLNYDGTKHQLAKNKGLFSRTVLRAFRKVRSAYAAASVRYWKWLGRTAVKVGGKVGGKLFGGAAKVGGNLFGKMFEKVPSEEMNTPTNAILAQILTTLQAQQPPEPEREGSWKNKAKKTAEGLAEKVKGARANGGKGMIGSLLGSIGGLFGKKDKDQSEEEDDGFGLDDAADAASTADDLNDMRKNRKGGKLGKAGKVGRMGKMMNGLRGMGGRVAGSRVGQMVATQGARLMGSTAMRAGIMMGAEMLAPLATGVAALLSAPAWLVVAGVAVVAGGGYLAYRAYKASGDFKSLRMTQYGIDSTGDKLTVLKLEELLEKSTDKSSDNPLIDIQAAGAKEILDVMGIKPDDEPKVMAFSRWMESRFKPVYLAYCKALGSIKQSSVALYDIDDKVPDELKLDMLTAVKFPTGGETPYQFRDNPFDPDSPLEDNIADIDEQFKELEEKFGKLKEEDKTKKLADAKSAGTPADPAKAAAAAGVAVTAKGLAELHKPEEATPPPGVTRAIDNVKNAVKVAALSGTAAAAMPVEKITKDLTALQSIRMRAYGMQMLNIADVEAMLTLEYVYSRDLVVKDGDVDYMGDFQVFIREAGTYLGRSTENGSDSRNQLAAWLTTRFAPAFRAYWGTLKGIAPAAQLQTAEGQLKITDKIKVANALMGATNTMGDSVWEIPSIFEVTGNLSDLRAMADADLKALREQGEKELAGTPTQNASDQVAGQANAQMGFKASVLAGAKDAWDGAKSTVSNAWDKTKEFFGGSESSGKPGTGSQDGLAMPEGDYKNTTGKTVSGEGAVYGTLAAGNGGQWEAIPMPTVNGKLKGAMATFNAAAAMVGVPAELLYIIAAIESGYRYDVKAQTSSAFGWFQFINDTWDMFYSQSQSKYGLPPDDSARSRRKDPRIQALIGAVFIKANYERLKKALDREISDTDIYIAHFLGAGGALRFLKADPVALGYQVFKKEYSANMPIFFIGADRNKPRTIAQIYKYFDDKIAKFRIGAGKDVTGPQTIGVEKSPEQVEAKQAEAAQAGAEKDPNAKPGDPASKEASADSPGAVARSTAPSVPLASPSNGGGGAVPAGAPGASADSPSTNSGGATVDAQRTSAEESALQQQARREAELRKSQQSDKKVDTIQSDQLKALLEIRDYMKTIAEAAGIGNGSAANDPNGGRQTTAGSGSSNSMTTPIRDRAALQRSSPMSLK